MSQQQITKLTEEHNTTDSVRLSNESNGIEDVDLFEELESKEKRLRKLEKKLKKKRKELKEKDRSEDLLIELSERHDIVTLEVQSLRLEKAESQQQLELQMKALEIKVSEK